MNVTMIRKMDKCISHANIGSDKKINFVVLIKLVKIDLV